MWGNWGTMRRWKCPGTRILIRTGVTPVGEKAEGGGSCMEWCTAADLVSQILHVKVILTSNSSPFLLLYLAWGNCFFFIYIFFFPLAGANGNFCDTPSPLPLKQQQLFICIYRAQFCTYKIGLCIHGDLESSARNISPLSFWLTRMASLMEGAQVVCKNLWHHWESWFCPSLLFEVTWMVPQEREELGDIPQPSCF